MTKKLYVGNLSYGTTEDQVRTLFSEVGEVSDVALITDRDTGYSKGFGFVEMATDESAQEAIKRFNGHTLDDRALNVDLARPRDDGGSRGSNYNNRGGGGRRRY
jgi:RNA recognition motif-containing protein